jgi:excinuclease ABC subunit C
LREALRIIRKIFPFRDAKSAIPHQERFYRSIGLSPDTSSPEAKKEYQKTIRNLALFFQGKKHELMRTLEKEMKEYAKNQQFEKAEEIKGTLYALMHIQDISLVKTENRLLDDRGPANFRIESYDIAHMSGKNNVGVMTVACDGEIEKSEYRKFKISKEVNDDTAAIREILIRRLTHQEWQMPNLIVIDGGLGQKNTAENVLRENNINIPVISVVKDNTHKAHHFLGDEALIGQYKEIILKLNAEAHRFAIAYHKNLRKRTFLQR